ncbi:MAG: M23 family metallopeptidase [Actinobacteria bacterium]|nr:M23 family metallopeptidase [Actinomycetota bacterium]
MCQPNVPRQRIPFRTRKRVGPDTTARVRALFPLLFCILFCIRFVAPLSAFAAWPLAGSPQIACGFNETYCSGDTQIVHHGVDIPAGAGDAVFAPQAGIVSFIGTVPASDATEGQTMQAVSLMLGDGRILTLMPFARIDVETGASVDVGDALGTLAATGDRSVSGAHLHMGLKSGGMYYDPLELLGWQETLSDDYPTVEEQQSIAAESFSKGVIDTPQPVPSAVSGQATVQSVVAEGLIQPESTENLLSSREGLVSSGGATLDSNYESVRNPNENSGPQNVKIVKSLVNDTEALINDTFGIDSFREVAVPLLGVSGLAFGCLGMALIGRYVRRASRVKGMNTERRGSAGKDKLALVADR